MKVSGKGELNSYNSSIIRNHDLILQALILSFENNMCSYSYLKQKLLWKGGGHAYSRNSHCLKEANPFLGLPGSLRVPGQCVSELRQEYVTICCMLSGHP